MTVASLAAVASAPALLVAPAARAAGTGTISGHVQDTVGNPIAAICVKAWLPGADPEFIAGAVAVTDAAGNYAITNVPADTNVLVSFTAIGHCPFPADTPKDYVGEWWNNRAGSSEADALTVADGGTVTADAELEAAARVSGKVTAHGAGIGQICVFARDTDENNHVRAAIGTNPDGTYTLTGVPVGNVEINVNEQVVGGKCPGGEADLSLPLARYNSITVNAGATTTQVDAALDYAINLNPNTIHQGDSTSLGVAGVPSNGTVTFSTSGHPNLCTVTLPATSCNAGADLGVGNYAVSGKYTPTHAGYTGPSSNNTPSLTVSPALVAPGAPTNVKATGGASGVKITWSAPVSDGGSAITGYTVTTAPGGKSVSVGGSARSATIIGLKPGSYRFLVRATNAIGASAWSTPSNTVTIVAPQQASKVGYWMLGANGRVYGFGDAKNLGSASGAQTAMTSRRDGKGYWVVNGAGKVSAFGAAGNHGGKPSLKSGEHVSAISATPSGNGYWLFTNLGRAFAYGDAKFYGDMRKVRLNGPIIASAATATGKGYYMVGSDGGVFTFGDAVFRGSTGAMRLFKPVVGISPTPDNKGYWLVASDGGVFAFHAPFRGSMGGKPLNKPVNGLVAFGNGYLMVASDGGVFTFSNKPFLGSLGGNPPASPIIGITAFTS